MALGGGHSSFPDHSADGKANREANQTIPEANLTKAAGIKVFTVGMTTQIDVAQLEAVCSDPVEGHYFTSTSSANWAPSQQTSSVDHVQVLRGSAQLQQLHRTRLFQEMDVSENHFS